jgi:hypothetical protein
MYNIRSRTVPLRHYLGLFEEARNTALSLLPSRLPFCAARRLARRRLELFGIRFVLREGLPYRLFLRDWG